jgi:hypothetical protein
MNDKRRRIMNSLRVAALVLLIAGVLGLVYGGFSYTKDSHDVKLGPVQLSVKEKERVNVPLWLGIGAVALGGVLLGMGGRKP